MIGAIADDFTGGTDVAVAFRRAGLRTIVLFGLPDVDLEIPPHDAVVIALKTRTVPAAEAVETSLAAARWLRNTGAEQYFFKFCSTFDSTPAGNIGPVADALADMLDAGQVVVVPSSPDHLRTQYLGHLFVDTVLLSESHMRHHPLTPMTESRIPEVLRSQTARPVALITHDTVRSGRHAVSDELDANELRRIRYSVIDAVSNDDLTEIGHAVTGHLLVTGAAGLAGGLGRAIAENITTAQTTTASQTPLADNVPAAVLAGSCSRRTLEQIAAMQITHPSHFLNAVITPDSTQLAEEALAWYDSLDTATAPLIYSSLSPEALLESQTILGVARSAEILETAMGIIAQGLVERGVRRLISAGGETSGAVVTALGVSGGIIGAEAAPGVPWIYTVSDDPIGLLLKSGNFGEPDLLVRASTPSGSLVG
jgi:uncharacterized protein YgbK (DUF1537 family)